MCSITATQAKLPLSEQQKIIETYTSDKVSCEVKRFLMSMTDKKVRSYAIPHLVKKSLTGAAVGGGIGYALSFIPVVGQIIGVTWATAGGATAGAGLALSHSVRHIERSDVFKEWLGKTIKSEVFPMFLEFIENDKEVGDLICSITRDYITFPMSLPDGRIYEKADIEDWLKKYEPVSRQDPNWFNASSPVRAGDREYTLEDLQYASDYFLSVIRKMSSIRKRVLESMPPSDIRRQGLEVLYEDISGDFNAYINAYDEMVIAETRIGKLDKIEAWKRLRSNDEVRREVRTARLAELMLS